MYVSFIMCVKEIWICYYKSFLMIDMVKEEKAKF